jgi:hypothetical protein
MKMSCIAWRFPLAARIDLLIERMPTKNDPLAGVNGRRIIAGRSCLKAFDCNQAMSRARCGQRISYVAILKNALEKTRERSALLLRQPKLKTGKQFAPCPRTEQKSRQVAFFLQKRLPAKYGRRKLDRTN